MALSLLGEAKGARITTILHDDTLIRCRPLAQRLTLNCHVAYTGQGQVGIDRLDTVAHQAGDMVHFPWLTRLRYHAAEGTQTGANQMVVYGTSCEEGWDGRVVGINLAIADHQHGSAGAHRCFGCRAECCNCFGEWCCHRAEGSNRSDQNLGIMVSAEGGKLGIVEDW